MSFTVISVEHITKQYDLGVIGTGTISRDLNRWFAHVRNQPDPYTRIGQPDAFARIGETILALDDVSFTVQQGEVLGIIGRNGAGKSTLLKILSRVTAPTGGVVKVKGRIGSLLEVGTGFHPELTGRENVYLNGAILGMKKAEITRKLDEIVNFAGVEKFIDTPVKRYSSGMYVRLAFAVAAHLESEILIVDEVLAVGDAEFQKKCLGKMGDVASREGRTVLFVSHNMAAIKNLCKIGVLLENGSVSQIGSSEEAVIKYLSRHTMKSGSSGFIGTVGQLHLLNISLCNSKRIPIEIVPSCEAIEFAIRYSSSNHQPISNVRLAIRILDGIGQSLFTYANYFTEELPSIPSEGTIICRVPEGLPLTSDKYKVTLSAQIEKGVSGTFEDILEFTIVESDIFGSGRFPDKHRLKHGSFVVPQTPWIIN